MNAAQRDEMLDKLDQIEEVEVDRVIAEVFPEANLEETSIGDYPATKFAALVQRMSEQLRAELESDSYLFCPIPFNFDHSNYRLGQILDHFNSHLREPNLPQAANELRILIGYETVSGFWDKSERKLHHPGKVKLKETVAELETTTQQMRQKINALEKEKDELTKSVKARKSELEEIVGAVQSARSDRQQIETLLNEATASNSKIETMSDSIDEELTRVKSQLTASEKKQSEIDTALEESEKKRVQLVEDSEFIEGKKEEIVDLTGLAAGGALGAKFEARRKSLSTASIGWLIGSVLASIAAAGWIAVATIYFQPPSETNAWLAFVWKLGLFLPAVFLLTFVGRQYAKERALEEEYAFRSAVAMTLNAFADLFDDEEISDERKKLVMETVEKLYAMPKSLSEKHGSFFSKRDKALEESVDVLMSLTERLNKIGN